MARRSDGTKSTSVMRKVDQLGRVVIPKELRKSFDIEDNRDLLEIYVEGDKIILKKFAPGCIFCGREGALYAFKDKLICPSCVKEVKEKQSW